MPMPAMQPPIFVDGGESFQQMVAHLEGQTTIAVDTESNSLHAYQEKVCLIQLSSRVQDFLLDPFAFDQLNALGEVFANPGIQKVFHAGDYDLTCLKRDYAFLFENIFDTMLAANALGETNLGLAGLLDKYLDVQLDKKYQRANWGKRPIKPEMLVYAQADSHYLIVLRDILVPLLEQKGRLEIVLEDSAALAQQTHAMKNHEEDFWRVRGINGMKPKALSLLKSLNHLREILARQQDIPPFKIMSDRALVEIAQTQPKYPQELDLLPSLSHGQVKRYGKEIMRAVDRWRKEPGKVEKRHFHARDDEVVQRREILGEWRKQVGLAQGLSSNVILPKELLECIAAEPVQDLQCLEKAMRSSPSRFNQYGSEILALFRKEDQ
ncbi:MAG: ribonuclease D [Anaerolineaceae bacterium]